MAKTATIFNHQELDRRFQSSLLLTRVPFWIPIFDPQPLVIKLGRTIAVLKSSSQTPSCKALAANVLEMPAISRNPQIGTERGHGRPYK